MEPAVLGLVLDSSVLVEAIPILLGEKNPYLSKDSVRGAALPSPPREHKLQIGS
jgi:hypothetical protein